MNEKIALHAMSTLLNGDLGNATLYELIKDKDLGKDQTEWVGRIVKKAAEMAINRAINLGCTDELLEGMSGYYEIRLGEGEVSIGVFTNDTRGMGISFEPVQGPRVPIGTEIPNSQGKRKRIPGSVTIYGGKVESVKVLLDAVQRMYDEMINTERPEEAQRALRTQEERIRRVQLPNRQFNRDWGLLKTAQNGQSFPLLCP